MKKGFNVVWMFFENQKIIARLFLLSQIGEKKIEISNYLLFSQVPTRKSTGPIIMNAIILHGKLWTESFMLWTSTTLLSVWTNSQSTPTDSLVHCSCSIYNSRHSLKIRQRPTCDKEGRKNSQVPQICDFLLCRYSRQIVWCGCDALLQSLWLHSREQNWIVLYCPIWNMQCRIKPYKAQSKKNVEWTSLQ